MDIMASISSFMPRSSSHFTPLAFVFDLDGTLVDSYPGIEASLLYAICFSGSTLRLHKLRSRIGPPISKMIPKIWPDLEPSGAVKVLRRFRIHYNREGCLRSRLYPGVKKVLKALKKPRRKIFLLTNKPLKPTRKILKHLEIEQFFTGVLCPDSVVPRLRNKKQGAKLITKQHRLEPAKTLLVGDSIDDFFSARAARIPFALALYGYGSKLNLAIRSKSFLLKGPRDLVKFI